MGVGQRRDAAMDDVAALANPVSVFELVHVGCVVALSLVETRGDTARTIPSAKLPRA